jgi:hypothetical protein
MSYCVVVDLAPISGRYGGRMIVWRRCDSKAPVTEIDKLLPH